MGLSILRASPGKAFSSPRQSPQPALAPSCPQGQRCGHAAGAQRLLHRAALSALGRGEEPEHTTQEEWFCTTGIGTWSDFRQERGVHDWHQRCGGDRRQRTPGRLSLLSSGCYGPGRNYLLLKALLLFLHVLHLRLQVPDLGDVRRRLREGKSAGVGAERRAGSRGRPPRGARCQRLARARASHHRPSEPLRRWTEGALFSSLQATSPVFKTRICRSGQKPCCQGHFCPQGPSRHRLSHHCKGHQAETCQPRQPSPAPRGASGPPASRYRPLGEPALAWGLRRKPQGCLSPLLRLHVIKQLKKD